MRRPRTNGAVVAAAFILISTAFVLATIPTPARASTVPLTGKYIMAFLACNTSTSTCSNPQNHVTHLAESNDSVNWSPVPVFKPYSGSVPDATRRGNTVYIYNPGTFVRFHLDTGIQDPPKQVSLSFMNGTTAIFVDPSLYLDSSGILHLFYLPGIIGQDPAGCPTDQSTCTKHIMSATEVTGSDGGSFIVDSGTRADYSISGCCFSDPAVFQGPGGYYLYVSEGQAVLAFSSSSLTGSYSQVQGLSNAVLVPQGTGGVPAGYYDNSTKNFWTFITEGQSTQVIARASTSGINSQISSSSFSTLLSGCSFQGLGCSYTVESPSFHLNAAGASSTTSTASGSTSATSTSTSSSSTSTSSTAFSSTSTTSTKSSTSSLSTTTSNSASTSSTTVSSMPSSSSTTSTSSVSSVTSPPSMTTASATSTGSGGVPEFPYQWVATVVLTIMLSVSYLLVRRRRL